MKLPRRTFLHLAADAAALPAASRIAGAQAYPSRPVRLIAPFAPGGATDLVARLMGRWLSERFGQQFIVENRPGAGGNIGTETVVRAPSDGYTLLVAGLNDAVNATLYDKLKFIFLRDIAPVASIVSFPLVMVVPPLISADDGSRVYCLFQIQCGQNQHGLRWQWIAQSHGRRTVQDDDGRQYGTRTSPRHGPRTDRHAWWDRWTSCSRLQPPRSSTSRLESYVRLR